MKVQETEIRRIIRVSGIPSWRIAEEIGITPVTLCIWTRSQKELEKKDREKKIRRAMKRLEKQFKTEDEVGSIERNI